ncbi:MAG: hypothetical protein ACKVVT_17240 [Dehalococcoidia bacterium]
MDGYRDRADGVTETYLAKAAEVERRPRLGDRGPGRGWAIVLGVGVLAIIAVDVAIRW